MATSSSTDASLKRLGGGRWQTRDERFTIEPQSGTWVVVDATQVDDLGLPLVRGPYPSLGAAKQAIEQARGEAAPVSSIASRKRASTDPASATDADGAGTHVSKPSSATVESTATPTRGRRRPARSSSTASQAAHGRQAPDEPTEPAWVTALPSAQRRRARDLLRRLEAAGAQDPEGIARRDIVGDVPAAAAYALERAIAAIGPDGSVASVVELLAGGKDEGIGVRWQLVDGEGRPITLKDGRPKRGA